MRAKLESKLIKLLASMAKIVILCDECFPFCTIISAQMECGYIAYIDEAGDDGIARVKPIDSQGSSEWFVLSAVVVSAHRDPEVEQWVTDIRAGLRNHQRADIHFAHLNPAKKRFVCANLATRPLRCFAVASNKKNMRGYRNKNAEQVPSRNWFYCWVSRVLLERVTHFVKFQSLKDHGEIRKVRLEFSERGGHSYSQMNAYYEWLKTRSFADNMFLNRGDLVWEAMDKMLLKRFPHQFRPGLQLADVVASSFFKACDIYDTRECNSEFAKLLAPRMARQPDVKDGLVAGYGLKLLPSFGKAKLLPEQEEIFRFYGYPEEWWDPDPSNPKAYRPPIYGKRPTRRTPRD